MCAHESVNKRKMWSGRDLGEGDGCQNKGDGISWREEEEEAPEGKDFSIKSNPFTQKHTPY